MGCKNSKENYLNDDSDKTKLERKLCIAKETPEPEFDLSECNLKEIPSGVFVLCKVLRKEKLILKRNRLVSLGKLENIPNDLELLTVVDLSGNSFKEIPQSLIRLKYLKELFLAENLIETLPESISRLVHLEILDLSNNHLTDIRQISLLPHLRILNISGNENLTQLPNSLSTCDNLSDIICDVDVILFPPKDILVSGTITILKYLATNDISNNHTIVDNNNKSTGESTIASRLMDRIGGAVSRRDSNSTQKLLEAERSTTSLASVHTRKSDEFDAIASAKEFSIETDENVELMVKKQQEQKQKLLKFIIEEQNHTENKLNELQKLKDADRQKLINNITEYENISKCIIDNLLLVQKKTPDVAILEQENKEREFLLEQITESELRKNEILSNMTSLLEQEANFQIQAQAKRDMDSKLFLEQENSSNELLNTVLKTNEKNRHNMMNELIMSENLQKSAVATLIEKNDARSWGLVQQIKIIEGQLAALTHFELEKRKAMQTDFMVDNSDARMKLLEYLLDLMHQQAQRKKQLIETINCMNDQTDQPEYFWLLQYQRLLDSQPEEMEDSSIEPAFGYRLLVNGVVQLLPFLMKIWRTKSGKLYSVTEEDLLNAGIKNGNDRRMVLRSIEEYLNEMGNANVPQSSAPTLDDIETKEENVAISPIEDTVAKPSSSVDDAAVFYCECVICLDAEAQVLFLPCGHLCCCFNCQITLKLCPLCRQNIEKCIKVIKS